MFLFVFIFLNYYILLKTTAEAGGTLVSVSRLGSRFATELVDVSRKLSNTEDQEKKIFKKAHYELVGNLLDGYVRRRVYYNSL